MRSRVLPLLLVTARVAIGCVEPTPGPPGPPGPKGPPGPSAPDGSTGEPPSCPPFEPPPGFGGPIDAALTLEVAQAWRDLRRAREEERLRQEIEPARIRGRYRVEQAWIDDGCLDAGTLVDVGRGLFIRSFPLEEGLGNGLAGLDGTLAGDRERPNFRRVQHRSFGGPDASSCLSCHWKGGFAGAGDRADNSILGDGDDVATADMRNPPALWGAGWAELVAREMTRDLHALREQAIAEARERGEPVTVALASKGISFGALTVRPEGEGVHVDTRGVLGVDDDLVIKPFGWKGTFEGLRAFLTTSLQVHLGLQAEEAVAARKAGALPDLDLGNGPDPDDPDRDGVEREVTEGQLTALELFLATLDVPTIQVPSEPDLAMRWQRGAERFEELGCAMCHVPYLPLESAVFESRAPLSGSVRRIDLAEVAARPRPSHDAAGRFLVPVFSDFKRHDMGELLGSRHDERGVGKRQYLTRRLWGLAGTSPWLHDGAAALLDEAIAMHGGEGSEARFAAEAFRALDEDGRADVRVFLLSLARSPTIRVR